jgi:hypothetical protein
MLIFKATKTALEARLLHPTLWTILAELADGEWKRLTNQEHVVVTEVWRSREQTIARYASAGIAPPVFSVHEAVKEVGVHLSGCRGVDISVRDANAGLAARRPYADWPFLEPQLCRLVADQINERWCYQESDAHQVALYHAVDGPHVHLQVRAQGETVRRVPT